MDRKSRAGTPLARTTRSGEHPLMTIRAAALALGYSDMTIRRKVEARQFPAVKIGCKALVPRAFVEQLIADAVAGRTVVLEEYAAAWLQEHGDAATAATHSDAAGSRNGAAR